MGLGPGLGSPVLSSPGSVLWTSYLGRTGGQATTAFLFLSNGEWTELLLALAQSYLCFAGGPLLYEGISLTMNSRVLNGSQRVVMDGVISDVECLELQRLTNVRAALWPHLPPKAQAPILRPLRC